MVGSVSDPQVTQLITAVNDSAFWAGQDESSHAQLGYESHQQDSDRSQNSVNQQHKRLSQARQPDMQSQQHNLVAAPDARKLLGAQQQEAAVYVLHHTWLVMFVGLTKPRGLTF